MDKTCDDYISDRYGNQALVLPAIGYAGARRAEPGMVAYNFPYPFIHCCNVPLCHPYGILFQAIHKDYQCGVPSGTRFGVRCFVLFVPSGQYIGRKIGEE